MNVWESIDYVAQWTKDHRERAGLSQGQLADRATDLLIEAGSKRGIKQQSIDQLEKRTHKGVPDWFRYVRQVIEAAESDSRMAAAATARSMPAVRIEPDLPLPVPDDVELIREVDLRFGMGEGNVIDEFPEIGHMPFNRNFRRSLTSAPADKLFIARGDGDSMMPTLINEDLVLIDQTQTKISQSDRIWALQIEDAGLIKRVRVIPGGGYELISDNPAIPPQAVERQYVHIIGRVIWVGRRV